MTATALLFRDDAYLQTCDATVVAVTPEGGVILDRTICYAQGGGQPGDVATIQRADGEPIAVTNKSVISSMSTFALSSPDVAAFWRSNSASSPNPLPS